MPKVIMDRLMIEDLDLLVVTHPFLEIAHIDLFCTCLAMALVEGGLIY